jgi:myosin heavy subunit
MDFAQVLLPSAKKTDKICTRSKMKITEALKQEIIRIVDERIREVHVTKEDFSELKSIVKELAEAQKNSEVRLTRLEKAVEELAEAQKNSEVRLTRLEKAVEELAEAQKNSEVRLTRLEKAVEELAEAQKNSEVRLTRLEKAVEELAQAQKRTEQRVEELAQAQKRTEQRVEELAEAQKRTEECLRKLIEEHRETRRQLGGVSGTVGYYLEDRALKSLPSLLKERYGITLTSRPIRRFLEDKRGRPLEVNIYAEGRKDGKEIYVIGESKAQLSKNDIRDFLTKKIGSLSLKKEIFPLVVTYMIQDPKVEDYAKEQGVALFYSYDLEL